MADTTFVNTTTTVPGTLVEAPWLNDVNTATYSVLNTVAGTNTITANGPSTVSGAYQNGAAFRFLPVNTNTGAVTININGIGVVAVTKYGTTPLVAGDIVVGSWAYITYDGTRFQLQNPQIVDVAHGGTGATSASQALINLGATGRLIGVQTFTASGTYTPTAGTTSVVVHALGGGAAGGGTAASAAGQFASGGGGGSGGYAITRLTSGFSGAAVTIGAGGIGVNGGNGGNGGATLFGAVLSAGGGIGGAFSGASLAPNTSGGLGGTSTLGNIVNGHGSPGFNGIGIVSAPLLVSGEGASTLWGGGGRPSSSTTTGLAGVGFGAGGGGAAATASQPAQTGGAGSPGILIIYEYS